MKMSISSGHITFGYRNIDVPFLRLPEITGRYNYSCGLYSNGHRERTNIIGMSEILMFDFDDGYPFDKCADYLKDVGITAYLTTSRNHQKIKGTGEKAKPACDRYRVMLPFDAPINLPFGVYQDFYRYVRTLLGFEEITDQQTPDNTRFFFPNPDQKTRFVQTGQVLSFAFLEENFRAWQALEDAKQKAEHERKQKQWDEKGQKKTKEGLLENEVSRYTIIQTKRGTYSLCDFEYLQGDDTVPCRCINPAHDDKNPSAFVGRSRKSGALMVRCSGCGFLAFMGAE